MNDFLNDPKFSEKYDVAFVSNIVYSCILPSMINIFLHIIVSLGKTIT